jgi:cytoskeletal protein RodZ
MTDTNAQARGRAMRDARLARARMIRRRIIGGAVALFIAAWLLITVVLVSGHDPALAKQSSASTVASSSPSTSSSSSSSSSSNSSGNSGSGSVSSVTTSQS